MNTVTQPNRIVMKTLGSDSSSPLINSEAFHPEPSLVEGSPLPDCQAIVILPARNEEASLPAALEALAHQVDLDSGPLPYDRFEIVLLLNNCTDSSPSIASTWQASHPACRLHIVERALPPESAHVGTARRLLMDTAWHRLQRVTPSCGAILSTDADTVVATDWIVRNLCALQSADAVGGVIRLKDGDLDSLPYGARTAYLQDRLYQRQVAELEHLLDPHPGDPWPRHLEHFGASLACTPEIYAQAGGMPPVRPLEDVAFVDALRRIDAVLRHDPAVQVYTSGRLDGRAEVGLSGQLRLWQQASDESQQHLVDSCAWLIHRFRTLHRLRTLATASSTQSWKNLPQQWRNRVAEARAGRLTGARFLLAVDSDRMIDETLRGERFGEIVSVNRELHRTLTRLRRQPSTLCEPARHTVPMDQDVYSLHRSSTFNR